MPALSIVSLTLPDNNWINPSGISLTLIQLTIHNFNTYSPLGYPWRYLADFVCPLFRITRLMKQMESFWWILAIPMILVSLYIGMGQWWSIYSVPKQFNEQGKRRNYSMNSNSWMGVIGAIGCLVAPHSYLNSLWWIPLLIDPGCALLFFLIMFGVAKFAFKRMSPRRNH